MAQEHEYILVPFEKLISEIKSIVHGEIEQLKNGEETRQGALAQGDFEVPYLTIDQACKFLNCSRPSLYRHFEAGLPRYKLRGKIYILKKDIERLFIK